MIAKEIAEYLEDQSIGTVGTNIFVGQFYDETSNSIRLIDTAGLPPEVAIEYYHPGVQIEVRNSSYATCMEKAMAIFDLLHNLVATTIESQTYLSITATTAPTYVGMDDNDLHHIVCNYIAFRKIAQEA